MKKIILLLALLAASPAFAQTGSVKTPAQINTEINSLFPDNTVGQITPNNLRQVTLDQTASAVIPAGAATANQIPVATGTGQGANWSSASSWFDQAYCNTVGFIVVRFTGAWTCSKSVYANPVWWGADPTGVSDSTTAFNNALAASQFIQFPAGKFRFNSPVTFAYPNVSPYAVTIAGAGSDATVLYWPSGNGLTLTYANALAQSAHVRDLSFTTSVPGTGSNFGLLIQYLGATANPATMGAGDIYNVVFRGDEGGGATNYWGRGIVLSSVSIYTVVNYTYYGPALSGAPLQGHGFGLVLQAVVTAFAAQFNVISSTFFACDTGISYGDYIQGVSVTSMNDTECQNGVVNPIAASHGLSQLSVAASQFAPTQGGTGILINNAIGGLQVVGNEFILSNIGTFGVISTQFGQIGAIVGNTFGCPGAPAGSSGIVVAAATQFKVQVTGNYFQTCTNGITIQAGATQISVVGNTFESSTISNLGTGNYIVDNSGYNPVGVSSAAYAPATTATYTAGASPETHYLTAGTVTAVKVPNNAGTAVCAVTPCLINLGPNETFSVTYTVAPTDTKSIH